MSATSFGSGPSKRIVKKIINQSWTDVFFAVFFNSTNHLKFLV